MPSLRSMTQSSRELSGSKRNVLQAARSAAAFLPTFETFHWLWVSGRSGKSIHPPRSSGSTLGQQIVQDSRGGAVFASGRSRLLGWLLMLFASLFLARFWTPPEAAVMGESLWLAILTMATGAILFGLLPARKHPAQGLQLWLIWGLLLLMIGQVAGMIQVWFVEGDRRAAANLVVEFFSLSICVTVLWRLTSILPGRLDTFGNCTACNAMIPFVIASLLSMSVLGVYQHRIGLPAVSGRYIKAIQELDRLEALVHRTPEDEENVLRLKQQLEKDGLPTDLNARRAFFQRLTSSEPYGFCALANTFAAILLVLLVLSLFAWPVITRQRTLLSLPDLTLPMSWLLLAAWVLGGWTLLLTKSRTAVLALAVTLAAVSIGLMVRKWKSAGTLKGRFNSSSRPMLAMIVVSLGALLLLISLLVWTGGLDIQVITEAPKSLRYRLEYWVATLQMLADHPWFGVGPGNFRSVYLWYKLPGSSEEIADPHNMILEAWSSGGLLSLAGLLVLSGVVFVALGRGLFFLSSSAEQRDPSVRDPAQNHSEISLPANWPFLAGLGSLVIAWWGRYLLDGVFDDALIAFALLWTVLYLVVDRCWINVLAVQQNLPAATREASSSNESRSVALNTAVLAFPAAALALGVNLLAAGGFGMPAIFGMWLLLVTASAGPFGFMSLGLNKVGGTQAQSPVASSSPWRAPMLSVGVALLCVISVWAAWPVWMVSQARLKMAERPATTRGAAIQEVVRLAELDPWSPSLAEAAGMAWFSSAESTTEWANGEKWMKSASERDVRSYRPFEQLARASFDRAVVDLAERQSWAEKAVKFFAEANLRYRSSSRLLGGEAQALALAGKRKDASIQAELALKQDELNRQLGHADRLLAADIVERLKRLQSEKLDEDLLNLRPVQ